MSDNPINVPQELSEAHAQLPIDLSRTTMPLDFTIRGMALTLAAKFVGDTCVKEGGLYQQLKMDNKLGNAVSLDDVIRAALVMERYIWGEWSKGIAEHALAKTETDLADALEAEMDKRHLDDDPTRPSSGISE